MSNKHRKICVGRGSLRNERGERENINIEMEETNQMVTRGVRRRVDRVKSNGEGGTTVDKGLLCVVCGVWCVVCGG